MEPIQLEMISVSYLTIELTSTNYLQPFINSADKEPSWDGNVFVHSSEKLIKKNLGKVPIQVKGKYQESILQDEITYPAQVIDLRNYLADGGAIYFVIYIKSYREYKIFYAQLEPLKLKEILRDRTDGTKSIKLKKLPAESLDIVNIFKSFLYHRAKQVSFTDNTVYTLDTITNKYEQIKLGFTLSGLGLNSGNLQTFIDNNNVYLYAESPSFPIPIPIMGQISKLIAIEEDNKIISINNEIFYDTQTRQYDRETTTLHFGDSFEFVINNTNFTFNYNLKSKVRILKKDLRFLILMFEHNGFSIDGHFFDMSDLLKQDKSFDIEKSKQALKEYEDIVELLDYLNIDGDIDISKLTDNERFDLMTLQKALINKEEVVLKENISVTTCMKIQNYSIALAFHLKENESSTYTIQDLFKVKDSILYSKNVETNVQTTIPLFRIMNAYDLAKSSNIHFDSLLEKYKILNKDPEVLSDASLFALQLILAADLCMESDSKRRKFLETSLIFMDWLNEELESPDDLSFTITRLNELQIHKRLRALVTSEVEYLIELTDSTKSTNHIKFGAYVLLDDKIRATNYLNKLTSTDKESMKGYPIYNLFKLL